MGEESMARKASGVSRSHRSTDSVNLSIAVHECEPACPGVSSARHGALSQTSLVHKSGKGSVR